MQNGEVITIKNNIKRDGNLIFSESKSMDSISRVAMVEMGRMIDREVYNQCTDEELNGIKNIIDELLKERKKKPPTPKDERL